MKVSKVFISYSHKDEAWKDRVVTQLGVLAQGAQFDVWEDRRIAAGDDWLPKIEDAIQTCDLALLLISADFLTSNFILKQEVPKLLERRVKTGVRVIPVILRPCAWKSVAWLSDIQARPKDGTPLSSVSEDQVEHVLASLTEEILRLTATIHSNSQNAVIELSGHRGGVSEAALQRYSDRLTEEIHNDLVREIVDKPYYEDICVAPMVASLDSRGEHMIVHRIEALSQERHSSITGEPGSGKTTALRLLALRLLRQVPRRTIPILLSLAAFKPHQSKPRAAVFETFVDDELRRLGCDSLKHLKGSKDIEPILLLDGWDETQGEESKDAIKSFLREGTCRYLLTSRPEEARSLPTSDRYEMQPLQGERILDFIRMRFRKERLANGLYARIQGNRALERLARNPLTLSIMTIVYPDENELRSMTKTTLYAFAFKAIMKEYHRLRSNRPGGLAGLVEKSIEQLLQKLAFQQLNTGSGRFFTSDQLMDAAAPFCNPVPAELPEFLAGRLAIIRARPLERYEFYHLWYQEFLAAKEIVGSPHLLGEFRESPQLASALPYVIGLLQSSASAYEVLRSCLIRDPFTFCRALAEGKFTSEQLTNLVMRLLNWAEEAEPGIPVREELARALAESGPATIPALYDVLRNEEHSDYLRRSALEGLVLLDDDYARLNKHLVQLLNTSCIGLLWHVVEQVGLRRITEAAPQLEGLCCKDDPITAGDSLWALANLRADARRPLSPEFIKRLLALLWVEDGHVQGHALRTIGRLRIAEALPALEKYFANSGNEYRWIVLQAAALIDGGDVMSLFQSALRDRDKRVVAEALLAIRDLTAVVPQDIIKTIGELREDTTWVRSKDQTVGDLAATTASRLASSPRRIPLARIYLARHSKTEWNLAGRLQGKTELQLCELGRKEAQSTARSLTSLNIDRIVTSTADRAQQTGRIFAAEIGVPMETSPLLRELDHGQWEGKSFTELQNDISSGFANWLANPTSAEDIPGSAESTVAAQHRIVQAICEIASTYRGQTVLVIAHKHINALFMCHLLKRPLSDFESLIDESVVPRLLPADALVELCQTH